MGSVAPQYAEAVFSLALEENSVAQTLETFQKFTNAIDSDIAKFLSHPKVSDDDKKKIVEHVVANDLVKHFIYVLIDNHHIDLIQDILLKLQAIVDNQNKIMKVQVFSRTILTEKEMEQLSQSLSKKHNREVELKNIVETTIVGGLRMEYDGIVLDDTINHFLHSLKVNLMK